MKFLRTGFRSFKAVLLGCVAAIAMSVGAYAGVNDPLQTLYVFSGVYDNQVNSTAFTGVATVVHCTNVGGTTENVQFIVLNFPGNVAANKTFTATTARTVTAVTHLTSTYSPDVNLATGFVDQGVLLVLGTSINFHCTAMEVDASAAIPNGITLQGLRYNAIPGTQY